MPHKKNTLQNSRRREEEKETLDREDKEKKKKKSTWKRTRVAMVGSAGTTPMKRTKVVSTTEYQDTYHTTC